MSKSCEIDLAKHVRKSRDVAHTFTLETEHPGKPQQGRRYERVNSLPNQTKGVDTLVSASQLLTACDAMLRELEQIVQESDEFVQEFKVLAQKLDLPSRDATFETLTRAESLLLGRLEAAKHLAQGLADMSDEAEKERARDRIAANLRQVRRARLFVQLKIFRLDTILERSVSR